MYAKSSKLQEATKAKKFYDIQKTKRNLSVEEIPNFVDYSYE